MENKANEKKKQKVSVSYTLKAFGNNINKLIDEKIVTKEDGQKLKEVHEKAVKYWIGLQFKL